MRRIEIIMATSEKTVLLDKILAQHKGKTKKNYMPLKFKAAELKKFGLNAKSSLLEVKKTVELFLGENLVILEVSGEYYLAGNMTADDLQREMDSEKTDLLLTILAKHKAKEKKSYLKVNAAILKVFAYNTKTAPDASPLAKIITPFLGSGLSLLRKPPATAKGKEVLYLAYILPPEEYIRESYQVLGTKKTFALKTLAADVPMSNKDFVAVLNRMLEAGQLQVTKIDDKFGIAGFRLPPSDFNGGHGVTALPQHPQLVTRNSQLDAELFRAAFEKLDRGRNFVRICHLRRELTWSEEQFNALLRKLRADGTIQLLAGDVSTMTEEDVHLSYTDDNNFFYAALRWKNP